jgi:catechol 2,3-dioxygenase-like lactoylglutathione lyase family enzyme
MLGETDLMTMIAVKNLDEATAFYENTLGLTRVGENPGGVEYRTGTSRLFVYPSEFAGTNKATTAVWQVDDLEGTVRELNAKGVPFEHYDNLPDTTRDGDIHAAGAFKIAWFKDPTGNILEVNNGQI